MSQISKVAVIDYGMGNLHSVASALHHVSDSVEVVVTADAAQINDADRVIFPGVGAIRDCMGEIRRLGLDETVTQLVGVKPILAICVGLQALMQSSEENGGVDCLGVFPGQVKFFGENLRATNGDRLKVPHMGWNQVQQLGSHPLWAGISQQSRFYFVHSYYVQSENRDLVVGSGEYGVPFDVALASEKLFAAQFHPEKSSTAGLQLLKNFLAWDGSC